MMSIRLVLAGYVLSLFAAWVGCILVARSRAVFPGLKWMIGSVSAALISVVLIIGRPTVPDFLSIVIGNAVMLAVFILLHQAIAVILNSPRRYLTLSLGLLAALFVSYLYFTYVSDDISNRILARTAAVIAQILISIVVLFRHKDPVLRSPIRVTGCILSIFGAVQVARLVVTTMTTPSSDIMHPDAAQAFFSLLNCVFGLCCFLGVLWLAFWAQRYDLQTMAFTDGLTGLMNRRAFDEMIEAELQSSRHRKQSLALFLIDIDSFKSINDCYGHLVGDEVIRRVGATLHASLRAGDMVSRYGGEEFVMVLHDLSLDRAESIAERLRAQVAGIRGLPSGVHVTVSIGIAVHDFEESSESLLKRSDDALYFAKRSGRNRVSVAVV